MMLNIDQPHLQQCPPPPPGQSEASGLVDNLARESALNGQWSSPAAANCYRELREVPVQDWRSAPKIGPRNLPPQRISLDNHIKKARAMLAELADRERRNETDREYRDALQWLQRNRRLYAGQWVALRGAKLLAAGKTAAEVYTPVRGQQPPALLVKLEAQELPFAGW